ncbi:hypothetical protein RHSIM_Rhsim05G0220600 [Rhododendron simsii]|uniref:Leucine-rich repeat-containing N-terminal plant-type domain-containing protein n=1 Tax=Rhododendron simsii TaxID=118357 RepID=A0A834LPK4_RHOSS|nr:hypothetical protein RHSIM_Rhsim05G0220600 [Rhododendron simsii]
MRIPHLSWLFLIPIFTISVSSQCLHKQKSLLLQLKNTLTFNPENSSKLTNWTQTLDCCQWEGVTCDQNGHVTGLDLSSESITNGIDRSSALFSLRYLETLNLAYNSLNSTPIPSNVGDLTNLSYLQVLDLSNNMLSGTIPQCLIENCTETLGVLNLGNNSLSGTISGTFPLGCVLKTLDLNGNHLEGHVPESLSNCTMLEVLNLGSNKMNGNFTCFLKNLSNLRVLVLRSNSFQGGIRCPELNNSTWRSWQKLQIIDIASNNFSVHLPSKCFLHWDAMMIGRRLGFGIGAGFAVGPLVFWKQGSRWCDEQIEEYVSMIGSTLSLIFSWCGGVKIIYQGQAGKLRLAGRYMACCLCNGLVESHEHC